MSSASHGRVRPIKNNLTSGFISNRSVSYKIKKGAKFMKNDPASAVHEIPFLPGVYLLEGNDYLEGGQDSFIACLHGSPDDAENQMFKDRIVFESRFVCEDDAALVEHFKALGIEKENDLFAIAGAYSDIERHVRKFVADNSYIKMLQEHSGSSEGRLAALDHVAKYMNYVPNRGVSEPDLRDAAISALQHDPDPKVRLKAAQVLDTCVKSIIYRSYDLEALDAITDAFENETDNAVRVEMLKLRAGRSIDMLATVRNTSENLEVRKEALFQLGGALFYNRYAHKLMTEILDDRGGEYSKELQAVAIGSLIVSAYSLAEFYLPQNRVRRIGANESTNGEMALALLYEHKIDRLSGDVEKFLATKGIDKDAAEKMINEVNLVAGKKYG